MTLSRITLATCLLLAGGAAVAQHGMHGGHAGSHTHPASPYAGEQARDIKALSPQEQQGWTNGQGMGLARAAELNGYPGPMHVLELADRLQLSDSQAAATRTLRAQHLAEVRSLGTQLVDAERQLDTLFRDKRATADDVQRHTEAIALLQARIRASHLQAHLQQTALLEPAQVERYNVLRGYR